MYEHGKKHGYGKETGAGNQWSEGEWINGELKFDRIWQQSQASYSMGNRITFY
jgi:hypothetical protein